MLRLFYEEISVHQKHFCQGLHLQQRVRSQSMPSKLAEEGMSFQVQLQKKLVQQRKQSQQSVIYKLKRILMV